MRRVSAALAARVASGALKHDAQQTQAAAVLDGTLGWSVVNRGIPAAAHSLLWPFSFFRRRSGVYLSGSVGSGKTMLMDTLHDEALRLGIASTRVHWNDLSALAHSRLRNLDSSSRGGSSKLRRVGADLSRDVRLLCLDELSVHDVADALMLRELLSAMLGRGVQVVATSNRAPFDLYEHGLNRDLFLPFVAMLQARLHHCPLDRGADYRRQNVAAQQDEDTSESLFVVADAATFRRRAAELTDGAEEEERLVDLPLAGGRRVAALRERRLLRKRGGKAAFATFAQLCQAPLSATDFAALAAAYDVLFLDGVPRLSAEKHDEARRFLTLIDVLYDKQKLVAVHADAPIDELLLAKVPSAEALPDLAVHDRGGSSGRLTTYIGEAEWSATGRLGVSLGNFAGVADTQFAWDRLTSRLVEITRSPAYRRRVLGGGGGGAGVLQPS